MDISNMNVLYNSHFEVGLRILFILEIRGRPLDIEELSILDYFLINTNDLDRNYTSLHSKMRGRRTQIFSKRSIIEGGIKVMLSRGLIEVVFNKDDGFQYVGSKFLSSFLEYMENIYSKELKIRSGLLKEKLYDKKLDEVANNISKDAKNLGSEYLKITLFN